MSRQPCVAYLLTHPPPVATILAPGRMGWLLQDNVEDGTVHLLLTRRALIFLVGLTLLLSTAPLRADEKEKGKPKGKEEKKPQIVQIDLSQLPPNVAKEIMTLIKEHSPKEGAAGKKQDREKPARKEGEKKPEGDRKPEGGKKPEGDRKPESGKKRDGDKKPEGGKKPEGERKSISLSVAVAIAEKVSKGQAVEASLRGEGGDRHFHVVVIDGKGKKTVVHISATGQVQGEEKKGDREDSKKPERKKKDGDKQEGNKGEKKKDGDKAEGKKKDGDKPEKKKKSSKDDDDD